MTGFSVPPLTELRRRESVKWRLYGDDVLPLWVAEMDYTVATVIREALLARVEASDLGYAMTPGDRIGPAFAGFAERHWGWSPDPARVRTTTDVATAIVEVLRRVIAPGDGVVIMPPIYPPFFELVPEAGGRVVEVPLLSGPWEYDVAGVEAVLASGEARAVLISNPHNPLGMVPSSLSDLAEVAARHGAVVVSDEIHGPLVHPGSDFTPFLSVSAAARSVGVCVTSASKSFNLAGTKCAVMYADDRVDVLDGMYEEVAIRTSLLGLEANIAAFAHADDWLAEALQEIVASSARLADLLAARLPGVGYAPSAASYLAWLDFRALPEWGDDPSALALERGVAINRGLDFGPQGRGFARLNLACSADVLTDAVTRLASP